MIYNHQKIDAILDAITPLPEEFGVIVNDYNGSEPVDFFDFQYHILKVDPEADIRFGMSKFIIIPSDSNVVIKIPFNGIFEEREDEDGNYEEELSWIPFYFGGGENSDDYCSTEYEKFLNLKKENLNCFVADTIFYKTISNFKVFLAEFVTPLEDETNSPEPSKNSVKIADTLNKTIRRINTTWLANCIDCYGEEKVQQFLTFCKSDPDILADMHYGNFGYRKSDNTPCILDYSNFQD